MSHPFRRSPPIPEPSARRLPWRSRLAILFGGPLTRAGYLFLAFSITCCAWFLPDTEPFYRSYDRMTPGEVIRVEPTDCEVGGDDVMAVDARYTDEAGVTRTVRAYTDDPPPPIGQTVAVLYDSGDPVDDVGINGMRPRPAPWWVSLFMLPFVATGLALALADLGASRRRIRDLHYATPAHDAGTMTAVLAVIPPLACVGLTIATVVLTAISWT